MTKYKLEGEQIQVACQELKTVYNGKWQGKNEKIPTLLFSNKKAEGTITFDDVSLDIKGAKLNKEFSRILELVKNSEKNKLKESDLRNSIFKTLFTAEQDYNGLPYNRKICTKIEKELKKFDIGEVKSKTHLKEEGTFVNDYVLLGIENRIDGTYTNPPSGFYTRLKTYLLKTYMLPERDKESFSLQSPNFFTLLQNEKKVDLKVNETLIGMYFPERNFIHLFFNPFAFEQINIFTKDIPVAIKDFIKVLNRIKVKKNNIKDIQKRLLLSAFSKKSKEKEASLTRTIKDNETHINSYTNDIRRCIENIHSDQLSLEFIKALATSSGEQLFDEIDKIMTLPFVKKVEVGAGEIDILFKATSIPIPNMIRNDGGKGFGKRFVYIGEVGFKISPGNFRVYGNCPLREGNPHPHGSSASPGGTSGPCFGDGDGNRKIFKLLSEYKFFDLSKMLHWWVRTYKNSGAYVKVWNAYDDRLQKGYPVFDEKGKRIGINDPIRLKTGEQKKLTKEKCYDENIKKYKEVKL